MLKIALVLAVAIVLGLVPLESLACHSYADPPFNTKPSHWHGYSTVGVKLVTSGPASILQLSPAISVAQWERAISLVLANHREFNGIRLRLCCAPVADVVIHA
jgi:hypothetical protein